MLVEVIEIDLISIQACPEVCGKAIKRYSAKISLIFDWEFYEIRFCFLLRNTLRSVNEKPKSHLCTVATSFSSLRNKMKTRSFCILPFL